MVVITDPLQIRVSDRPTSDILGFLGWESDEEISEI